MGRRRPSFTYDEIYRLVKGVLNAGLAVDRVNYDGEKIEVLVLGGEPAKAQDGRPRSQLIREPKL